MQDRARLTLLGTGTCQLQDGRAASSVLIEFEGLRVLLDMGRGIARRVSEVGLANDDIEHIVLSHFHPDHVSDLIPFLHAACWSRIDPRKKDLNIYGPVGVKVQVMRVISLFGPDELIRPTFDIRIHEIREPSFAISGVHFDFVDLPPANNHGLKFRVGKKTVALTADSYFHDQEVDFVTGADIAVIDAGHLSENEIVELAVRSHPELLVLSHLYHDYDQPKLESLAASAGFRGKLVIGKDLLEFEV